MSIQGRVEPDTEIDPADLIEAEIEEEDQGLRLVTPRANGSDASLSEAEKRARKKIRDQAVYYAQTSGGEIEDWVEQLTPNGRSFSDTAMHRVGYDCEAVCDYTSAEGYILYQAI